jgi:hypothetical protein
VIEQRLDRLARQTRTLQRVRDHRSKVDDSRWRKVARQLADAVIHLEQRVANAIEVARDELAEVDDTFKAFRTAALAEVARLDTRISQVRDQALSRHLLLEARVAALEAEPPA